MSKAELRKLVAENKLNELFEALKNYPSKIGIKDRMDQIAVFSARLGLIQKDKRLGVITDEHYRTERGKITLALLELINELPKGQAEGIHSPFPPVVSTKINKVAKGRKRFVLLSLIATLALLGAALAYWLIIPHTSLRAEVTTDIFSFRLIADWELDDFLLLTAFEIENLSETTGFYQSPGRSAAEAFDLELTGEYIVLSDLKLKAGSTLTIQSDEKDLLWSISGAPVQGKIDLALAILAIPGLDIAKAAPDTIPEVLLFTTESFTQFWLSKCDACQYDFNSFTVDSIAFEQLTHLDPPVLESSVLSGRVYDKNGKQELLLRAGDWLFPEIVSSGSMNWRSVEDKLQVSFDGVRKIKTRRR